MSNTGAVVVIVVNIVAMFWACWRTWELGYKAGFRDGGAGKGP